MIPVITSGLREVACTERSSEVRNLGGRIVATTSGMFQVHREIQVSAKIESLLASILTGTGPVEFDGVKIGRPASIQITMTGFKRWEFSPAFPVSVTLLGGIDVAVNLASIELVNENGPALLVTTESKLKPDLLISFTVKADAPEVPAGVPSDTEVDGQFEKHKVPSKHREKIRQAVGYAWGPKQIAPIRMQAVQGNLDADEADKLARVIVQELVDQQVISAGLFFWMQLGYWLIKIISALIQARRAN